MTTKENIVDVTTDIIEKLDILYNEFEHTWQALYVNNYDLAKRFEDMQCGYGGIICIKSRIEKLRDDCLKVVKENEASKNLDSYLDVVNKLKLIKSIVNE